MRDSGMRVPCRSGSGARGAGIGLMNPKAFAVLAAGGWLLLAVTSTAPGFADAPQAEAEPAAPVDWTAKAAERLPMLAPCEIAGIEETALCGTIEVPEDRSVEGGRRIGLYVVVVPAHAEHPPSDPITFFAGGPGGAATGRAAPFSHVEAIRGRDALFVDQRGTGRSHRLDCDFGGTAGVSSAELPEMFPPAEVRACAERLSRDADLHLYTSVEHADDVEEVRRRLGYGPLNVQGGSYGTHAAMVFAERHPESTRTLFLIGVDSPLRSNLGERGVWTERTLAGLARACASEADCARVTPDLYTMTADLFDRLAEAPKRVEVADPQDPETTLTVEVGHDWLVEKVRLLLYYGFTSRALPWAVHRAHDEGDWAPLTRLALVIGRFFRSTIADGVLLTVQCSEGMELDVERALARNAATLFGNYRLAQQVQGCANWPYEPSDLHLGVERPRPLPIPTLLLSGRWDPVTPPAYGEDATAYFPNSRHLVLDEGQHGPYELEGGWTCVNGIWADFLDRGTLEGLDTTCADHLTRQPFLTDAEAFREHLEGTLAGMID